MASRKTGCRQKVKGRDKGMLKVKLLDAYGKCVKRDELATLFATDMKYLPYHRRNEVKPDGEVYVNAPAWPVILNAKLVIPGYGHIWVVADNCGQGYKDGAELDFVREAALSRVYDVEQVLGKGGFTPSVKCLSMLNDAKTMLKLAETAGNAHELNVVALASSLWAGDLAVVERARQKIAGRAKRDGFLFGCAGFNYPYSEMPILKESYENVFNYATLPFYLVRHEWEKNKPDYTVLDKLQDEFEKKGIVTKAHPLWWAHTAGMPPWTKDLKWEDGSIERELNRVVKRSVERYKGRIHYYDVINEAHDWCNAYMLTQQQEAEMTKMCVDAVHDIDPSANTVINTCFMFGENVADERVQWGIINERNMTPYSYLQRVEDLGTQYDTIGIQLYCPSRDMLAIDKLYDRYSVFGKPLHLTELGVPSGEVDVKPDCTDGDLYCLRYMYKGLWHEMDWSERVQGDWIEDFYTISYAREEVEALTWWSIWDGASYVPGAGIVTMDGVQKEGYFRLKELEKSWGFDFGNR